MADKSLPWGLKSEKIAAGSVKAIPESKMKAFESGSMTVGKKGLSKREQEEHRRKLDEVETAQVYQDFVAAFEDTSKQNKTWVRGGTFNADKGRDKDEKSAVKIYKPTSKLAELASTFQSVKEAKKNEERDRQVVPSANLSSAKKNKKWESKKKSNLELFKEELKAIQEERKERHQIKKTFKTGNEVPEVDPNLEMMMLDPSDIPRGDASKLGSYDPGDENTTNIYVGNINPKMSEQELCQEFGGFGPLASVKIMWPRTDEERSRGRNCGFVAFMNRKDGERAMNALKGKDVMNFEMKLGWGKAVPIPPHPVYIPPALAEMTQPPPPSGLPFNAQRSRPRNRGFGNIPPPDLDPRSDDPAEIDKTLANAVVKVVIPTERNLLSVIHRMIEFVVREGPMFEAMIMNREISNPMFRFLFNNRNPAHTYYRWKLYSILQGDSPYKWQTEEFKMFKGGSLWRPPPMNPYTQGMPDELVDKNKNVAQAQQSKGQLTDSQRDRLEDMLRELTPERAKIADGMVWCLDHAESADEVVECITEALSILQTPIPKKIARLFLVSDILYNSSAKVPNASFYRKYFQEKLVDIFKDIRETYEKIDGRLKAEQFKQKVMSCFRAWEDWTVYPNDFLINLQNIFLGLVSLKVAEEVQEEQKEEFDGIPIDVDGKLMEEQLPISGVPKTEDLDGKPLDDLDGEPIDEEVDVVPLSSDKILEDVDGKPIEEEKASLVQPKFAESKWESVDEAELKAQAMTTSKWDMLDQQSEEEGENENVKQEEQDDLDGQPLEDGEASRGTVSDEDSMQGESSDAVQRQEMSEERRAKLREIEVKVVKYQDELEAGKRSRKPHMSLSEQVHHHRRKLLAKVEMSESPCRERKRRRSRSISPLYCVVSGSPKRSKRQKSPKKYHRSRSSSRSRSPYRRSVSRSPVRHRHKHKKNKKRDG